MLVFLNGETFLMILFVKIQSAKIVAIVLKMHIIFSLNVLNMMMFLNQISMLDLLKPVTLYI